MILSGVGTIIHWHLSNGVLMNIYFRAGTSTGVMTNAILTIVKHTFEILPRVIECAPVYTEGDQSNAVGYHLYIEALFVKINLTSIMFWLLKVLFKRAVALTPLPAQTTSKFVLLAAIHSEL